MLNIYRASAGSGKTYRLTQDYIQLLFDPRREHVHRRILAVTFTNKATDEMKTRILHELYALASHAKSDYRKGLMEKFRFDEHQVDEKARKIMIDILHDYSSFQISTIDKFFQQVIRAFAREIGVHGGYNLQVDTDDTLTQSVDNLFLALSDKENPLLLKWLTRFAEDRIEDSKNWDTRESITALGREIFKESYQFKAEETNRKLHDRVFLDEFRAKLKQIKDAYVNALKENASSALAVMQKYGLSHSDFSRSSTKILDEIINGRLDITKTFVAMAESESKCYTQKAPANIKSAIGTAYHDGLQQAILNLVQLTEQDVVRYNSADIVLKHINTLGILSDLAMQIRKLTGEQNTMLLSDTNMLLNRIIDESDAPFVYEKSGIHIDNFMIDEFQDTSVLQWKNFYPLIWNSLSSEKFNLVVGDVKQSIYRWRNSDWKLLDEKILTDFRPDQIHEEELDTNWRSDRNIVEFNNTFFKMAAWLLQKKLNTELNEVLPVYPDLAPLTLKIEHAYKNTAQKTKPNAGQGFVKFEFIPNEKEEKWTQKSLERLPAILEDLQERGYKPSDVGILVKKNDEAMRVTRTLLSYKTTSAARKGFVYDIMGNEGLQIAGSHAVRFILGLLRLFISPNDTVQKTIVQFEFARAQMGMSDNDALNFCFANNQHDGDYSGLFGADKHGELMALRNNSLFEMVEKMIALFGVGQWADEAVFVQAFQDVVFKFSTTRTADLYSFLKWWYKNGEKQCIATPDQQNAFRVMTIHKSKGLDFKVVVVPFCDWDFEKKTGNIRSILWCTPTEAPFNDLSLLPVEFSKKLGKSVFAENYYDELMHQYIDNLNVAYVAFTRARHELICLLPEPGKEPESEEKINSISSMIYFCLKNKHLQPYEIPCDEISEMLFCAGIETVEKDDNAPKTEKGQSITSYPTVPSAGRLRILHQSKDYFQQSDHITESRLNYGIVMHEILKQISVPSDQGNAIQQMVAQGIIDNSDADLIKAEFEKFWNIPKVAQWFLPHLKVLNEATILTPSGTLYRPDRVVLDGNKAIVVDYKFGDVQNNQYISQVKEYMDLMTGMGYKTEGYLCYHSLGKVETVTL